MSDREAAALTPEQADATAVTLQAAEALVVSGKGSDVVTMQYGFVPMTAYRFVSLVAKSGGDDYFSSDFTDDELAAR